METRRTTVRDVRRANRASLLTDLFHGGRQSRQQLGDTTALSQASVSNLIGEMIDEGLVEEAGLVGSDGGRPRSLLRVAPDFGYVAGADVSETRVLVELYDLAMSRLGVAQYALPAPKQPDPCLAAEKLLEGLAAVMAEAGVARAEVLGFGVGVAGVVDQSGGAPVVHSQPTGWDAVPLGAMLRDGTDVPIHVENGAKAVGQAEMWFGAGRGARHAVIVLVGEGVGAAVVMDGRGYRGAHSNAGEWGHTTLVYDGDLCRCGARGCLEAYIGADRIAARLAEATGLAAGPDLLTRVLADEPLAGAAAEVLRRTVGYLGAGIAGLINLFSPERIVLGGRVGLALGERFLTGIREAAARNALRHPYSRTRIDLCQLGPDAVAMGAATLPIARLLADGGLPTATGPAPMSRAAHRRAAARDRT
ncbi:ROK family protein [Couchioplanes caeruleus]|uniref:Sugar kinase n=2 Tax=Couchioplanes caeruleus TaxID=56438 RepID=A0A1K0FLC7_9ACTN|nr:ROK family protein [Couchioplanes caeruleus]OJF13609.1 sugar kinase [Couchioplanes caeruleus subsp. caeruleus]ROP33102.1 putative NBD/HSP70 family sugar kinase [Couchioplanes caeruleus]